MSVWYVYIFVDPKRFVGAVELIVLKQEDFMQKFGPCDCYIFGSYGNGHEAYLD